MNINLNITQYEAESLCAILGWVVLGTTGRPNAISRVYEEIEQKMMEQGYDPEKLLTVHNLVEIKKEDSIGIDDNYALRFMKEYKHANKMNNKDTTIKTIQSAQVEASKLQSIIKQRIMDEEQLSFDFDKKKKPKPIDVFDISFDDS